MSTGAVCADESMHQRWKHFRWWFLRGQRLNFPWLFLSQQGLCALMNPWVSSGNSFGGYFWVGSDSVFLDCLWDNRVWADESIRHLSKQFWGLFLSGQRLSFPWLFPSQQRLCGLTNPCVTSRSSFGDDFWVCSESVFLDSLCVNRGSVRWWIHASGLENIFGDNF